jgi:hypothetical protein
MQLVGNCLEKIPLQVVEKIKKTQGDVRPSKIEFDQSYKKESFQKWIDAGYDLEKIKWSLYYAEHLDNMFSPDGIVENITHWWFVKLDPGNIFPYHKDVFGNERKVKRYWVACEDYKPGHIFSYGTEVLTGYRAGDIFTLDAENIYHGAANIGFEPKISLQISALEI